MYSNNRSTGAIFIYLTKAFDMVNDYILLDKLYAIGCSLRAILFSIFINDLPQICSGCQILYADQLYADDTDILYINLKTISKIQTSLQFDSIIYSNMVLF